MTSISMRRCCTMVVVVSLRCASGGNVSGSMVRCSSRVTVNVSFFLGLPRGVRVRRSASDE
ncbi:MAG: hypothetical protein EI684_20135 [Candidatus Viridilinea halotolerans]|uniref:Uncharacterized protein n=1 Tax=Candidatus Viridilinea halotolerans TaxID=2491704 RepID=A0A426TS96_9CHLR|nr:MAG: hypothetical protein EI684_20135 [Candidatus Viridilinea halotolerans]